MNIGRLRCFSLEKLKPKELETGYFRPKKVKVIESRQQNGIHINIHQKMLSKKLSFNISSGRSSDLIKRKPDVGSYLSPSIVRLREKSNELVSPFTIHSKRKSVFKEASPVTTVSVLPYLKPRSRIKLRFFV